MRLVPLRRLLVPRIAPGRSPACRRQAARRRTRRAILLFPVALVALVAVLWVIADRLHPAATDPDFCSRRDLIHERLAEKPGAALVLALGSSRTSFGFDPELLPPMQTASGRPLVWFNMGHNGADLVLQLVTLKRLLAEGIRPNAVLVEIMPPYAATGQEQFLGYFLSASEIVDAWSHVRGRKMLWHSLKHRLASPGQLRQGLNGPEVAPSGKYGAGVGLPVATTEADRQRLRDVQYRFVKQGVERVEMSAPAESALREIVATCRMNSIEPVLLLLPEGPIFRGWYDQGRWVKFREHLDRLAVEMGVRFIDAREWLAEEHFVDSHHPSPDGAKVYTPRLVEELRAVWERFE